jgi:HK97 family phage prohead protease
MKGTKLPKHTLLTREEALRARDLIRERLGPGRHLKITTAALTKARDEGTFTGYASTFDDDPDLAGDVIAPGAFVQSIKDWEARVTWPPLLWNHDTDSPSAALGVITNMVEDDRGLLVTGNLDLGHEPAAAVWRAMKSGRITTFSFAYAVLEEKERKDGVNVLLVLDILEVSVTPKPANRNAQLVSVKTSMEHTKSRDLYDPSYWNDQLDRLEFTKAYTGPALDPDAVDRFVTETRQMMIEEALARAEQAAWESRMQLNAVLDPVPVRVDARMRPVTS